MKSLFTILAVLCCGMAAQAQTASEPFSSPLPYFFSNLQSVLLDDIDGDGFEDYAVGDITEFDPVSLRFGSVRIISSATNAVIITYRGGLTDEYYGFRLAAGDYNGDGTKNLIIARSNGPSARLDVVDPTNNSLIAVIPAPTNIPPISGSVELFGQDLDLRDVDADGKEEILCCSRLAGFTPTTGVAHVFAGGSGILMATVLDLGVSDFANKARFLDDINNDGIPEVLITSPGAAFAGNYGHGTYGVYNIQTGTPIYSAWGTFTGAQLGEGSALIDDLNADGICDFIVTEYIPSNFDSKKLRILSGADGSLILTVNSATGVTPYNIIRSISDLDGDGLRDIAILGTTQFGPFFSSQSFDLYSSGDFRHLDRLSATSGIGVFHSDVTVVPDVGGDGFEDILLGDYLLSGVAGPLKRMTLKPILSPTASGNHPSGIDFLSVNNSAGLPARRVDLAINEAFSIGFATDPSTAGPTDFIIFGMIGVPNSSTVYPSTVGDFVFPPRPAFPGFPWLFTLADSVAFDQASLFTPGPAPYLLYAPLGVFFPVQFVLQGVTVTNGAANVSISNAILIDVR